jgi:hypothetical protein
MQLLKRHRFVLVSRSYGAEEDSFQNGLNYTFQKHGECAVCLLKDGRIHLLNGPLSRWELHDHITDEMMHIVLAFCNMNSEMQECFRTYVGQRCRNYNDIFALLPAVQVDWKNEFLKSWNSVGDHF